MKMIHWIKAARLRTLPLSLSGIVLGMMIAAGEGFFNIYIAVFSVLTTVLFQVLSNFANDYGDSVKGTDNEDRVGPMRAIQSGEISKTQMKKAILITSVMSIVSAIILIYISFGRENFIYSLFFFVLGLGSIAAAIKYTVGSSAYGYRGLGDVFVFIFFGLVSVLGSYFLYSKEFNYILLLPAIAIGLFSVGVLNLNNMRDRIPDEKAGKMTLALKLGAKGSKIYHFIIIIIAIVLISVFSFIKLKSPNNLVFLFAIRPIINHLVRVYRLNGKGLDPELKKLALTTFFISLLLGIAHII